MREVAIIGAGMSKEETAKKLAEIGKQDVLILTPEEYAEYKESEKIETHKCFIENYYNMLPEIQLEKPFTCKGKHQYREQNGEWICQCGRKL